MKTEKKTAGRGEQSTVLLGSSCFFSKFDISSVCQPIAMGMVFDGDENLRTCGSKTAVGAAPPPRRGAKRKIGG